MSEEIYLRSPFPVYELPRLWQWCVSFRQQVMDDYGPQDEKNFVLQWIGALEAGLISFAVYRKVEQVEELGGIVTLQRTNPVSANSFFLFKRPFWGKHTSFPASKEALRQAFEQDQQLRKVNLSIFADNHQLSVLAHSLGYKREGRIRQATMRRGQLIDTFTMGLTREDFEKKWQPGYSPQLPQALEPSAVS